jgi:hypothetical protein
MGTTPQMNSCKQLFSRVTKALVARNGVHLQPLLHTSSKKALALWAEVQEQDLEQVGSMEAASAATAAEACI